MQQELNSICHLIGSGNSDNLTLAFQILKGNKPLGKMTTEHYMPLLQSQNKKTLRGIKGILKNITRLKNRLCGHYSYTPTQKEFFFICDSAAYFPNIWASVKKICLHRQVIREIPTSIKHLKSLEKLDLTNNKLIAIPAEIGELSSLRALELDGNQIKKIPSSIGNLHSLTKLTLERNQLNKLPHTIGKLPKLQVLNLRLNLLSELPTSLIQLKTLEVLCLDFNQLSQLPDVSVLPNLTQLDLMQNKLQELPQNIGNLTELSVLDFNGNQIRNIPASLFQSQKLTYFNWRSNPLDATSKAAIKVFQKESKYGDKWEQ